MTTRSTTAPDPGPSGTLGGERKGWVEQVALVAFIAVPFLRSCWPPSRSRGAAGSAGRDVARRSSSTRSPATASRSASTATSRTARSRPSARCGSGWRSPAAWRSRARRSAGWPTTASTTSSPTRRATRTRRGATARRCRRWSRVSGTPTWAGCSTSSRPRSASTPPTCSRTATSSGSAARSVLVAVSLAACPPVLGGLMTWSWHGALTAFFWASLVRVGLLHHVTWSINSICHAMGERPFESRDQSGNVWWLAVLSMGESWHNLHHADPTCARHGVLKGQVDSGARVDPAVRDVGWAYDVRWPTPGTPRRPPGGLMAARRRPRERPSARPGRPRPPDATGRLRMTGKERREQLLDIGRSLFAEKGFDAHVGRGDRRQGRRLQAGRLRALRRQGRPLRRRRRPRDARAARRDHRRLTSSGHPRELLERAALRAARLHRDVHRRLPHPGARLPGRLSRPARFASPHQRRREPGRAHHGQPVQGARLRPEARADVRADARRHGRAHRPVVAGRAQAEEGRGRRAPGQPRVERPVRPRGQARAAAARADGR